MPRLICTLPIAIASAPEVLDWLRQRHIQILVATPSAIMGAEHTGVSPIWHSELPIRIPMAGQVDSLNVAQAAAILLFEAVRQRSQSHTGDTQAQGTLRYTNSSNTPF